MAEVLKEAGKWELAEAQYKTALVSQQHAQGVNHPDSLRAGRQLAVVLRKLGKFDEAETILRQVSLWMNA